MGQYWQTPQGPGSALCPVGSLFANRIGLSNSGNLLKLRLAHNYLPTRFADNYHLVAQNEPMSNLRHFDLPAVAFSYSLFPCRGPQRQVFVAGVATPYSLFF